MAKLSLDEMRWANAIWMHKTFGDPLPKDDRIIVFPGQLETAMEILTNNGNRSQGTNKPKRISRKRGAR